MGLFSPKSAPKPAAKKAPAKKAPAKRTPTTIVHAAKTPTAAERRADELHRKSQQQWTQAEQLERAGGNRVEITLLKQASLENGRRSQI